jgi:hypothetical protein
MIETLASILHQLWHWLGPPATKRVADRAVDAALAAFKCDLNKTPLTFLANDEDFRRATSYLDQYTNLLYEIQNEIINAHGARFYFNQAAVQHEQIARALDRISERQRVLEEYLRIINGEYPSLIVLLGYYLLEQMRLMRYPEITASIELDLDFMIGTFVRRISSGRSLFLTGTKERIEEALYAAKSAIDRGRVTAEAFAYFRRYDRLTHDLLIAGQYASLVVRYIRGGGTKVPKIIIAISKLQEVEHELDEVFRSATGPDSEYTLATLQSDVAQILRQTEAALEVRGRMSFDKKIRLIHANVKRAQKLLKAGKAQLRIAW